MSRLIYVAGPFSAKTRALVQHNIKLASELGVEIARVGGWPLIPHANTSHPLFEAVQPYQFWIDATMAMLRVCHAVALVERWEQSSGARGEEAEARRLGIPVFYPGIRQVIEIRDWLFEQSRRASETLRPSALVDDLDTPHCGNCGRSLDAHEHGFAGRGCPTGGTFYRAKREPMPTLDESEAR